MTKINKDNYGLGLNIRNDNISHNGGFFFTTSQFQVNLKKKIGYIIYTNSEMFGQTKAIINKIEEIYFK